jgi:hypothetical protein
MLFLIRKSILLFLRIAFPKNFELVHKFFIYFQDPSSSCHSAHSSSSASSADEESSSSEAPLAPEATLFFLAPLAPWAPFWLLVSLALSASLLCLS